DVCAAFLDVAYECVEIHARAEEDLQQEHVSEPSRLERRLGKPPVEGQLAHFRDAVELLVGPSCLLDVANSGKTVLDEAPERHVDVALGGAPEHSDRAPYLSLDVVPGALPPTEDAEHRGLASRDQLLLFNVRHGLVLSILVTPGTRSVTCGI